MPVTEKTQTAEEKAAAGKEQKVSADALAKKIISTLDLPAGLADAVDEAAGRKPANKETPAQEEEGAEEGSEGAEGEDAEEEIAEGEEGAGEGEAGEGAEEGEEGSEDGKKPEKSKTQKRIDELVRENKRKDAEIKRLKGKETAPAKEEEVSDPDQRILNKLADRPDALEKLRQLKRDTQTAWKKETDEGKATQLLDLQDKIDETIAKVPQRFSSRQLNAYREELSTTIEAYGEDWTEKTGDAIFNLAKGIYSKSAVLQRDVNGQAEALRQAVERFEETKKLTAGKDRTERLQRENNTLKKKTALDIGAQKSNTDKSDTSRMFHKAKAGNNTDKAAFVKRAFNTDSLIPEEYRK